MRTALDRRFVFRAIHRRAAALRTLQISEDATPTGTTRATCARNEETEGFAISRLRLALRLMMPSSRLVPVDGSFSYPRSRDGQNRFVKDSIKGSAVAMLKR
jgi:hypothetical protein